MGQLHDTIDQLRLVVCRFVDRYSTWWLIQRRAHLTPRRHMRHLNQQPRHDQLGTTAVQETGGRSRRVEHPIAPDIAGASPLKRGRNVRKEAAARQVRARVAEQRDPS